MPIEPTRAEAHGVFTDCELASDRSADSFGDGGGFGDALVRREEDHEFVAAAVRQGRLLGAPR